jgi:hypothetical protein
MELSKFKKKCEKCIYDDKKLYFVIYDRYHYHECCQTYYEIKKIIKEVTKPKDITHICYDDCVVKESEYYTNHLENLHRLKNMGYTQI